MKHLKIFVNECSIHIDISVNVQITDKIRKLYSPERIFTHWAEILHPNLYTTEDLSF